MNKMRVIQNRAQATSLPTVQGIQRVAAYCRVSTLMEEQEDSYETQCTYYRRMIDADPCLTLVDVYGDHGISGLSTVKRPEFMRMMKDCMDGRIDRVMTKSISRFARNLADSLHCIRQLREKGIPVFFEKEGFSGMDGGCDFLLSVLSTMAQEEINTLSQHIKWSLEHRNASGDPARMARYGYRKVREDGKTVWRIEENEAAKVRLAYQMAAQGCDYRRIVTALDAMEWTEQTGPHWTRARVREMLLSEIYIGDILTNKAYRSDYLDKRVVKNEGQRAQYYLEEHHEPIIDRVTFMRVGNLIRANALRTKRARREK